MHTIKNVLLVSRSWKSSWIGLNCYLAEWLFGDLECYSDLTSQIVPLYKGRHKGRWTVPFNETLFSCNIITLVNYCLVLHNVVTVRVVWWVLVGLQVDYRYTIRRCRQKEGSEIDNMQVPDHQLRRWHSCAKDSTFHRQKSVGIVTGLFCHLAPKFGTYAFCCNSPITIQVSRAAWQTKSVKTHRHNISMQEEPPINKDINSVLQKDSYNLFEGSEHNLQSYKLPQLSNRLKEPLSLLQLHPQKETQNARIH